jgi:hypothetical protein
MPALLSSHCEFKFYLKLEALLKSEEYRVGPKSFESVDWDSVFGSGVRSKTVGDSTQMLRDNSVIPSNDSLSSVLELTQIC